MYTRASPSQFASPLFSWVHLTERNKQFLREVSSDANCHLLSGDFFYELGGHYIVAFLTSLIPYNFQMVWSMLFNAFLFAFFYARLARSDARGAQVVLSDKALMTVVNGQVRFQIRVYDVDAGLPVVEAHIRMLAVTKSRPVPRPLRLLQPNDELGGMLFLSAPAVVTHHVDIYSVLHPPRTPPVNPSGIILRQVDSVISSREEVVCPVCGESYGTRERWRNHVSFQRIVEEKENYPIEGTHRALKKSDFIAALPETNNATLDIEELKEHFSREISEVICIVEGIEPSCSGTFASVSDRPSRR